MKTKVVKKLARKKKTEDEAAGSPWMATFADLMNLLLCFFVLLFASSTVDAEKYEQIVNSMTNSFSIFSGGGSALDEGRLISSGISQLNELDEYSSSTGKNGEDSDSENYEESDALNELLEANKKATLLVYDEVADKMSQYNLGQYIELSVDSNYRFVKISLSGSILFDSGEAEIKSSALPVFSKLGDILALYNNHHIEIEGHTDNVPMKSGLYPNNNWLSSARALNTATYLIQVKKMDPKTLSWTGRGEYEPVASNSTSEGRAKNRRVEIKIYNEISK
ncbi:MAG: OmpA/MotB domain protein [Anaerocolumna sp.]|jgi:chemotaxis protein MotB|nr:OmpA/MotB domain protein [Anaerocolumna sp.]